MPIPIPLTREQKIIDALEAALKSITIANGYRTNIGDRVLYLDGQKIEYKQDTVVFGESNEDCQNINQSRNNILEIAIESYIFFKGDGSDRYASTNAKADIITAIGKSESFGQNATITAIASSSTAVELEGERCVKRELVISINYRSDKFGS